MRIQIFPMAAPSRAKGQGQEGLWVVPVSDGVGGGICQEVRASATFLRPSQWQEIVTH